MTITQIAVVVADMESALRPYTENLGWGPWSVFDYKPPLLHDAGIYSGLLKPRLALRRRAATFQPDQAAAVAYDERYATWREIYRRMLDITDDGLLNPLWRAAGA